MVLVYMEKICTHMSYYISYALVMFDCNLDTQYSCGLLEEENSGVANGARTRDNCFHRAVLYQTEL